MTPSITPNGFDAKSRKYVYGGRLCVAGAGCPVLCLPSFKENSLDFLRVQSGRVGSSDNGEIRHE